MQDIMINGLLYDGQVRFVAISAAKLVNEAHHIHDTTATTAAALGRTLMGTVLMAAMEKNDNDKVTVRIQGGGETGTLLAVAKNDGTVKGYIVNPHVELPRKENGKLNVGEAVGKDGTITVVRDLGMGEPYTGQANLISGEIAEDFGSYFAFSQQQPSLVYLGVHISKEFEVLAATGLILQPMPGCADFIVDSLEQKSAAVSTLTNRVKEGASLSDALKAIFSDTKVDVMEERNPRYVCDCSRERLEQVLISLGKNELQDILDTDGQAELKCHFCNQTYQFNRTELEKLLAESTLN